MNSTNRCFIYLGKKINYKILGTGNCLVLLHGFLESLNIWEDFAKELSGEFKVITVDLPGHGGTEQIGDVHTMELMADTVKAVLANLQIQECVMIGHSMGGYVTLEFASKYPEYLLGIGLFHSSVFADSAETKQNRERTIELIKKDRQGFIRNFIPDLFAAGNRLKYVNEINHLKEEASLISNSSVIAALAGMKERKDHRQTISTIDAKVLFIMGQDDQRIPLNKVVEMISLPNHSDVLILSDVGHMGYIEAKDETLEKCRYFARKCLLS
jgi:pimeloyl-ACP methyl ester carboxylesterase